MNNDETLKGYLDGFQDDREDEPPSLTNRTASYRHGWLNGRDDRLGRPRASAEALRRSAQKAQEEDRNA